MKRSPQNCADMKALRAEIDRVDRELMDLLAERTAYIDRAIEIKMPQKMPARISVRVEEVVNNARKNAESAHIDPNFAANIWREIVEWSIAREEEKMKGNKNERNNN